MSSNFIIGSKPPTKGKLRNVFDFEDEPEDWKAAVREFPNHVPLFASKAACLKFMEKHAGVPSNPDFPELTHCCSLMTTWDQVDRYIIPQMRHYNLKYPPAKGNLEQLPESNRFLRSVDPIHSDIHISPIRSTVNSRLSLKIHRKMTFGSVLNTFRYLFFHMKCGIYVMIRDGKVVVFSPFCNRDYTNTWGDRFPALSPNFKSVQFYYGNKRKSTGYREEDILPHNQWWANGNIICNEQADQLWHDTYMLPVKDLLNDVCNSRLVPDCDFFINKRDFPQIRVDSTQSVVEAYDFVFSSSSTPLATTFPITRPGLQLSFLAPVLSFYSNSSSFADIMFPPSEDIESAVGQVYCPSLHSATTEPRDLFTDANFSKFNCDWEKKKNCAFFRGSATGGGCSTENNQRLALASMDANVHDNSLLDAKLVKWNFRDKKLRESDFMSHIIPDANITVSDANFVPIYQQGQYKYLIYVQGHCAACRYSMLMRLKSAILKIDSSCEANEMWYFGMLRPYFDHIPVKADLSDLIEKIHWCREHDEECRQIASNAHYLYSEYISRQGLLDYMQMVLFEISSRFVYPVCFSQGKRASTAAVSNSIAVRGSWPGFSAVSCNCPSCQQASKTSGAQNEVHSVNKRKILRQFLSQGNKRKRIDYAETTTTGNASTSAIMTFDEGAEDVSSFVVDDDGEQEEEEEAGTPSELLDSSDDDNDSDDSSAVLESKSDNPGRRSNRVNNLERQASNHGGSFIDKESASGFNSSDDEK